MKLKLVTMNNMQKYAKDITPKIIKMQMLMIW